jgi:hypothetical protein
MLFGDSRSIGDGKRKVAKKHFGYFHPSSRVSTDHGAQVQQIFQICGGCAPYGVYSYTESVIIEMCPRHTRSPRDATDRNTYGEDDHDLVRRFAIREDGTARYPVAITVDRPASNVISLEDYRRQVSAGGTARKVGG